LRFVSRVEEVKVVVPPPPIYTYGYPGYAGGSSGGFMFPAYQAASGTSSNPVNGNLRTSINLPSTSSLNTISVSTQPPYRPNSIPYIPYTPPVPLTRTEKATRSYIVHEETQGSEIPPATTRSQNATSTNPSWNETMKALFGAHVNWEEVKVYAGKGRPTGEYPIFLVVAV
jgi:hypothetical protein